MSSSTGCLVLVLVTALMIQRLHDLYLGGHYACPRCGARRADRHADECRWRR
jgi:hypothetical protein